MLSFTSVTKSFPSGAIALENIDFGMDKGEMMFLTGASGAGKTTIMRLLTIDSTPSSGSILFEDQDLTKIKKRAIPLHRRKIGVVFQDYKLLSDLNAWENIALSLEIAGKKSSEIEKRVSDLLKLIKLEDKAELFPSQLSGGEAQRISIARALATAPSMIFADEPTGNLDVENSKAIISLLRKINELGTSMIVATHDLDLVNSSKNIRRIHLEDGKIVRDSKKPEGKKPENKKRERTKDTNNESRNTNKKDSESLPRRQAGLILDPASKTKPRVKLKLPSFMSSRAKSRDLEKSDD